MQAAAGGVDGNKNEIIGEAAVNGAVDGDPDAEPFFFFSGTVVVDEKVDGASSTPARSGSRRAVSARDTAARSVEVCRMCVDRVATSQSSGGGVASTLALSAPSPI